MYINVPPHCKKMIKYPDLVLKRARRRRCDAHTRINIAAAERALRAGRRPGFLRSSGYCRNWALPGSNRCRLHGGRSTGPVTAEGMARTVAAMKAGRLRWLANLKAEGKQVPCGRKKGGHNRPAAERERAAREAKWLRDCRRMAHRLRTTNRKSLREQRRHERQVAADLAMRRERFRAGLGFWTEEELERL
jgi:hypothetical protein